jgi:hypothetical protein
MLISHHQNVGRKHNIQGAYRYSENVKTVQIFGYDNNKSKSDSRGIKKRLNSGNVFCYSAQNLLSCLLSITIKIEIYINIIFPVYLHGHKTWSLTLREKHRQRVFDK